MTKYETEFTYEQEVQWPVDGTTHRGRVLDVVGPLWDQHIEVWDLTVWENSGVVTYRILPASIVSVSHD